MYAPYQTCRTAEHTQIHQLNHRSVLDHRWCSTLLADRSQPSCLDMDPHRFIQYVVDTDNRDVAETDKQLAHDSEGRFPQGLSVLKVLNTVRLAESRR